jgi:hypothetical protein
MVMQNKLKSKFRSGYSRLVQGLLVSKTNRNPTKLGCSMKLLEVKLKTNKKHPLCFAKIITGLYSYQKNKPLILKN